MDSRLYLCVCVCVCMYMCVWGVHACVRAGAWAWRQRSWMSSVTLCLIPLEVRSLTEPGAHISVPSRMEIFPWEHLVLELQPWSGPQLACHVGIWTLILIFFQQTLLLWSHLHSPNPLKCINFVFICMNVLFSHTFMHHVRAWCLWRSEERAKYPGAMEGCEPPWGCWE